MARETELVGKGKVVAYLSRKEMDFLERLGKEAIFSTGHRVSREDIISALIESAMELKLSAKGIKTKEELVAKLVELFGARAEKRRYPRLNTNLIAGFRRIDSMEEYARGLTEDVSIGGFKVDMECPDPSFSVDRAMEITIIDPRQDEPPVKAFGKIAWMKEKEDGLACEIGVKLTYMHKEDRKRYMRYMFHPTE